MWILLRLIFLVLNPLTKGKILICRNLDLSQKANYGRTESCRTSVLIDKNMKSGPLHQFLLNNKNGNQRHLSFLSCCSIETDVDGHSSYFYILKMMFHMILFCSQLFFFFTLLTSIFHIISYLLQRRWIHLSLFYSIF